MVPTEFHGDLLVIAVFILLMFVHRVPKTGELEERRMMEEEVFGSQHESAPSIKGYL